MFVKVSALIEQIAWPDFRINGVFTDTANSMQNFRLKLTLFADTRVLPFPSLKFPTRLNCSFVFTKTFDQTRTFGELLRKFESDESVNIQLIADDKDRKSIVIAAYCDSLLNFLYPFLSLNIAYDHMPREIKLTPTNRGQNQNSAKINLVLSIDVLSQDEQIMDGNHRDFQKNGHAQTSLDFQTSNDRLGADHDRGSNESIPSAFSALGKIRRISSFRSYMSPTFSSTMMAELKMENLHNSNSSSSLSSASSAYKRPFVVKKVPQDLLERLPVDHVEMPPYNTVTGGSGPRHLLPSCDRYWMGRDKSLPDFFKYSGGE